MTKDKNYAVRNKILTYVLSGLVVVLTLLCTYLYIGRNDVNKSQAYDIAYGKMAQACFEASKTQKVTCTNLSITSFEWIQEGTDFGVYQVRALAGTGDNEFSHTIHIDEYGKDITGLPN